MFLRKMIWQALFDAAFCLPCLKRAGVFVPRRGSRPHVRPRRCHHQARILSRCLKAVQDSRDVALQSALD